MAVAIVIEDGTGVANANSFVELAEARAYAADRGITLPSDNDAAGAMVVLAGDYINSFRNRYKGRQVYTAYPMTWPRSGVNVDGEELDPDTIPEDIKRAQMEGVLAVQSGLILLPNVSGGTLPVKRRKVGPLEREFFGPSELEGYDWTRTRVPAVEELLRPYLKGGGMLRTARA